MTGVTDWGEALFLSLSNALNAFLAAIPLVIAALLIIIIGWIISNVLARIVREILERAGADRLFAEHSGPVYGTRSSAFQPSIVAAEVVKWIVRFIFLIAAANIARPHAGQRAAQQRAPVDPEPDRGRPHPADRTAHRPVRPRRHRGRGGSDGLRERGRCSAASPRSRSSRSPSSWRSTSSGSPRTSSTSCSSASSPHLRSRSAWRSALAVATSPHASPRTGTRA